jgi:two-component system cell cycle sensor histidine kinase/response regulator CckA
MLLDISMWNCALTVVAKRWRQNRQMSAIFVLLRTGLSDARKTIGEGPPPLTDVSLPSVDSRSLDELLEAAPDAMLLVDEEGAVRGVNELLASLFGYTREELLGQSVELLVPGAARARHSQKRGEFLSTGSHRLMGEGLELRARRKDGNEFTVEIALKPVSVGGRACVVASVRSLGTRTALRRDVQEILDCTPVCILVSRGDHVLYANPALLTTLGFTAEEVGATSLFALLHPEDREAVRAQAEKMDASAVPPPAQERRYLRKDGGVVHFHVRPVCRVEYRGAPARLVVLQDLTPQRLMQAQLLAADRMASVGILAAGVAHEVNNPLAFVISNLGFIRDELETLSATFSASSTAVGPDWSECLSALGEAVEGAERIKQIVRGLKTFSRADDEARRPVDVRTVLERSIHMVSSEVKHRASVECDFGDVPAVYANEGNLGQVFLNLLVNAAQATPTGAKEKNRIHVVTRTLAGGWVAVEIQDTGSGIAPENLSRLFTPFFTTKPVGEGTGLGLSISKNIVEALGGKIEVSSELGKGTTFRILLAGVPAAEAPAPTKAAAVSHRPWRMLVIDDEPGILRMLERTLRKQKCQAALCPNVTAALERLATGEEFDLILCDVMMPECTGRDFYEAVSNRWPSLARRIVFMTGAVRSPAIQQLLERLPNEVVEKPFTEAQLISTLTRVAAAL